MTKKTKKAMSNENEKTGDDRNNIHPLQHHHINDITPATRQPKSITPSSNEEALPG